MGLFWISPKLRLGSSLGFVLNILSPWFPALGLAFKLQGFGLGFGSRLERSCVIPVWDFLRVFMSHRGLKTKCNHNVIQKWVKCNESLNITRKMGGGLGWAVAIRCQGPEMWNKTVFFSWYEHQTYEVGEWNPGDRLPLTHLPREGGRE